MNLEKEEAFVVKISDCDMKAREYVVVQSLKNLHWADISSDMIIRTIHGETVGKSLQCNLLGKPTLDVQRAFAILSDGSEESTQNIAQGDIFRKVTVCQIIFSFILKQHLSLCFFCC